MKGIMSMRLRVKRRPQARDLAAWTREERPFVGDFGSKPVQELASVNRRGAGEAGASPETSFRGTATGIRWCCTPPTPRVSREPFCQSHRSVRPQKVYCVLTFRFHRRIRVRSPDLARAIESAPFARRQRLQVVEWTPVNLRLQELSIGLIQLAQEPWGETVEDAP